MLASNENWEDILGFRTVPTFCCFRIFLRVVIFGNSRDLNLNT